MVLFLGEFAKNRRGSERKMGRAKKKKKNGDIGARYGRQVTLHPGHEKKEKESNLIQSTGGNCMAGSCALLYGAFFLLSH